MKNRVYIFYTLLLVASCGIFCVNKYQSHDWGDDFALYLMQAEKTSEFSFQKNTLYVFNSLNPIVAPAFYPPIFPAFLSVFYSVFNHDVAHYITLMHILLVALTLLLFHFLSSKTSLSLAFIFSLLFIYNPWILHFKNEIMSEFLFTALLLLFVLFYTKNEAKKIYMTLIAALLIGTRSIGWIVIPAILTDHLLQKRSWSGFKKPLFISLGIIVCALFFNLIFTGKLINSAYVTNFDQTSYLATITINSGFYLKTISNWFIPYLETRSYLIYCTHILTISLLAIGIIHCIQKKENRIELLLTFFYLIILLVYPYQGADFRFVLPIIPFLFLFMLQGILFISSLFTKTVLQKTILYSIPLFLLVQYWPNLNYIINNKTTQVDGPQNPLAIESWLAIQQHTTKNDTIYFTYPKVLAYYGKRHSKAFPKQNPYNIHYFLTDNQFPEKYTDELKNSRKFDTVWSNQRFILFKKID